MNRIVKSWNSTANKSTYNGSDTLKIDVDEILTLPSSEGEKLEVKKMTHPDRKISINESAVKELALHGPQDRVETLFAETHRTLKRLDEEAGPRTRVFRRMPRATGGRPNLHDLMAWMNGLMNESKTDKEKFSGDINFLKQLHVTIRARVHLEVLRKVEGK